MVVVGWPEPQIQINANVACYMLANMFAVLYSSEVEILRNCASVVFLQLYLTISISVDF